MNDKNESNEDLLGYPLGRMPTPKYSEHCNNRWCKTCEYVVQCNCDHPKDTFLLREQFEQVVVNHCRVDESNELSQHCLQTQCDECPYTELCRNVFRFMTVNGISNKNLEYIKANSEKYLANKPVVNIGNIDSAGIYRIPVKCKVSNADSSVELNIETSGNPDFSEPRNLCQHCLAIECDECQYLKLCKRLFVDGNLINEQFNEMMELIPGDDVDFDPNCKIIDDTDASNYCTTTKCEDCKFPAPCFSRYGQPGELTELEFNTMLIALVFQLLKHIPGEEKREEITATYQDDESTDVFTVVKPDNGSCFSQFCDHTLCQKCGFLDTCKSMHSNTVRLTVGQFGNMYNEHSNRDFEKLKAELKPEIPAAHQKFNCCNPDCSNHFFTLDGVFDLAAAGWALFREKWYCNECAEAGVAHDIDPDAGMPKIHCARTGCKQWYYASCHDLAFQSGWRTVNDDTFCRLHAQECEYQSELLETFDPTDESEPFNDTYNHYDCSTSGCAVTHSTLDDLDKVPPFRGVMDQGKYYCSGCAKKMHDADRIVVPDEMKKDFRCSTKRCPWRHAGIFKMSELLKDGWSFMNTQPFCEECTNKYNGVESEKVEELAKKKEDIEPVHASHCTKTDCTSCEYLADCISVFGSFREDGLLSPDEFRQVYAKHSIESEKEASASSIPNRDSDSIEEYNQFESDSLVNPSPQVEKKQPVTMVREMSDHCPVTTCGECHYRLSCSRLFGDHQQLTKKQFNEVVALHDTE